MPRCSGSKGEPWEEEHEGGEFRLNSVKYFQTKDRDEDDWYPNRVGQKYMLHYRNGLPMTATDDQGRQFNLRWGVKAHMDLLQGCILNVMCTSTKDPFKYVFSSRAEMLREMKRRDPNTVFCDDEYE
jgi:hypothetical protein